MYQSTQRILFEKLYCEKKRCYKTFILFLKFYILKKKIVILR